MTPERVGSLSHQAMLEAQEVGPARAIKGAITQAVNEFAEEAKKACMDLAEKLPTSDEGACEICASAIDALKLPEE